MGGLFLLYPHSLGYNPYNHGEISPTQLERRHFRRGTPKRRRSPGQTTARCQGHWHGACCGENNTWKIGTYKKPQYGFQIAVVRQ